MSPYLLSVYAFLRANLANPLVVLCEQAYVYGWVVVFADEYEMVSRMGVSWSIAVYFISRCVFVLFIQDGEDSQHEQCHPDRLFDSDVIFSLYANLALIVP